MWNSIRQPIVFIGVFISSLNAFAGYDRSVPKQYVPALLSGGPDAYFAEINSGWYDEQYASLKAKLSPGRSYIVLHNRLPSAILDLRTPNGFRQSVFNLGLLNVKSLDIGHVMLGWHCEINGKVFEGNTGITGEQENQQTNMGATGWGLTGIFSIFKDGHLQTPLLVRSVFRQHRAKQIATLAFEVEPAQCGKMLTFLNAFLHDSRQPYKRFGLNADPLNFEGGGCGSFGAATLSASGVIDGIFPHLWRELYVNQRMFGYGLPNLPSEIEPYNVPHKYGPSYSVSSLKALFLMNWNSSSKANSLSIRLMDPELLFLMQHTVMRASLDDVYRDSLRIGRQLIQSPFIRNRIVKENEEKIDARFDGNAAAVVEGSKHWYRDMKNKGYRARGFEFNGHPAVLLTR